MKGSIAKELSINLLVTVLASSGISILLALYLNIHPNVLIGVFMYNICLLIASSTIYLNLSEAIRKSGLYSMLSFFLLPAGVYIVLGTTMGGWLLGIPFLYVHLYYFMKFRKMDIGFGFRVKLSTTVIFLLAGLLAIAGTCRYFSVVDEANSDFYQGYVFDEENKPVPNVSVKENRSIYQATLTDSAGYFRLYGASAGISDLIFEKEGYLIDTFRTRWSQYGETIEYSFLRTPGLVTLRKDTDPVRAVTFHWKHLEGNWVLADYFDNILKYKTIAKYRLNPLAMDSWAFRIANDSLFSVGLGHGINEEPRVLSSGSGMVLYSFPVYLDTFQLRYDAKTERIDAVSQKDPGVKYTYRRATGRLDNILTGTPFDEQIDDSIRNLFTESIIAGSYAPVQGGQSLVLSKDGTVKGFNNYHTYWIHCFFGTSHPCGNNDAIMFNDTLSGIRKMYNWRFSNGKLILTEMLTDNGDIYYVGTRSYAFVRK